MLLVASGQSVYLDKAVQQAESQFNTKFDALEVPLGYGLDQCAHWHWEVKKLTTELTSVGNMMFYVVTAVVELVPK